MIFFCKKKKTKQTTWGNNQPEYNWGWMGTKLHGNMGMSSVMGETVMSQGRLTR